LVAVRADRNIAVVILAALTAVTALAALAGCGVGGGPTSIVDKHALVIGVDDDQPGLGRRLPDGGVEGFDVDVATYVAGRLGVAGNKITFRPIPKDKRDAVLRDGTVDMLLATYSILPSRKPLVTFAGPYYVAHQDILVRQNDTSIKTVRDLSGKRLCHVNGSFSWNRVIKERGIPDVHGVDAGSYRECVTMLTKGRMDAVATDDLILAGIAAETGSQESPVRLVNAPFNDERYGIGLRKGDLKGCEAVNRALTEMYQSGAVATMLQRWFGSVGLQVNTSVPQFEGCA
jgi:glutamate transport system substrate-binding protein